MASFNVVLKQLRLNAGLTQGELARRLHMATSSISMYEKGTRRPSMEVLEILADFFNVDMDYLLGKSSQSTYYLDEDTARLAKSIRQQPQLRALFETAVHLPEESLREVLDFARFKANLTAKK